MSAHRPPFPPYQATMPLVEKLRALAEQFSGRTGRRSQASFHTPGHKRGQGISPDLREWLGEAMFQADLPELPELDNLFAPESVIQQAQILAAEAFGADQSWFLVNGSTCGVEAAILAVCSPGDRLILPRNVHQSAISGLILSGAIPVFVEPEFDPAWDLAYGVTPQAIEAALSQHPEAKAVLLVSPTYHGVCADIQTIAPIVHQYGIPLLVDEAHGSHFPFHPDLPTPALQAGADLAVQSIHKTLSALTQAAMLHLQGTRIDGDRLTRSLQLVQSTSPNYLLLASLDAARQQMATQGKVLLTKTLDLAAHARTQLPQILGVSMLTAEAIARWDWFTLDPTRLTVDVTGLGLTGFEADELLHQTLGVTAELPTLRQLSFILSPANPHQDIDRLIHAFQHLSAQYASPAALAAPCPLLPRGMALPPAALPPALSPRQAFFAPSQTVAIESALARISAEWICPYPPGIPVLIPGEVITQAAIDYLRQVQAAGGVMTGGTDPELQTLKVVQSA
ncbi:aminotransferase class I/II-fold pyridoxal phosphate-dependent enzyme [Egbenema bharatensis]|uniref:aminotransferase class I/II-fold pyridoxal phosphate-dependent enzyme n=1 Tax=Egbenema bharatensis TaxID=3463334 RepID=UPI003A874D7B